MKKDEYDEWYNELYKLKMKAFKINKKYDRWMIIVSSRINKKK